MTPTIYVGDHQHAKVVCSAFAEGCGGKLVPATSRLREGPAAMWGILRGAGDRIKECEIYGHPYFYIDHGYFARGHYDGHYRVVFCDRHLPGPPQASDGKRWGGLGVELQRPRYIFSGQPPGQAIYLPISRHVAAFLGINAGEFDEQHIGRLRDRGFDVAVSSKEGDGGTSFDGAALIAGFQSNALLEADAQGFRVEEFGDSPAKYLGGLSEWTPRESVFHWLADNQWTLEEMRSGKCWTDLMARYGDHLTEAAA